MAVMLCADDYAMTDGISRGIEQLAAAGRLSATSAIVTGRHWPMHARRVDRLRHHVQVGLHLNLTLGRPLTRMAGVAPGGELPGLRHLLIGSLSRRIDANEIRSELRAQFQAFSDHAGRPPDFVDGHQHVHVLPIVRDALLAVLAEVDPDRRLWVRDPHDGLGAILARGREIAKASVLALLAAGFGRAVARAGWRTNHGFAGVSAFDRRVDYAIELDRFFVAAGPDHLIMCHPGHVDAELATLDPVRDRRADELDAISRHADLQARLITGGADWRGARGARS